MSVAEIFASEGEESFRDVEAAVLNEVSSYGRVVVSTGGGVVMRRTNWGHLRNGLIVYLNAPAECAPRPCCAAAKVHCCMHVCARSLTSCCASLWRAFRLLAARVAADGVVARPLLAGAPAGGEVAHAQARAHAFVQHHNCTMGAFCKADTSFRAASPAPPSHHSRPQRILQEMLDARAEMYSQADVTVTLAASSAESAESTAERALAALDALLEADDTRQRLRRVPDADSVKLEGSRGPLQI
jgi:hypothetical protein